MSQVSSISHGFVQNLGASDPVAQPLQGKQSLDQSFVQRPQDASKLHMSNLTLLGSHLKNAHPTFLNALRYSPQTVRALMQYQLKSLAKAQDKEKKLKAEAWKGKVALGTMSKEAMTAHMEQLAIEQDNELRDLEGELNDILEEVEHNRLEHEGCEMAKFVQDEKQANASLQHLDKLDDIIMDYFVKDLPKLDAKQTETGLGQRVKDIGKRLFSWSGLSLLATTAIGTAAVALGAALIPATGVMAAIGITANMAAPCVYSSVSSLIAIFAPETKAALEHIDDVRKGLKGTSTELPSMKRQLDKDRHEEVIAGIDKLISTGGDLAPKDEDYLHVWKQQQPPTESINRVGQTKRLIDVELFGLSKDAVDEHTRTELSQSPAVVHKLANQVIAKQKQAHARELQLVERRFNALIAHGSATEEDKAEALSQRTACQATEMHEICARLSEAVDDVTWNREYEQGKDAAAAERSGDTISFAERIEQREATDKKLMEKFCNDLPQLLDDKKPSTLCGRLFSWSGAKMLAMSAFAAVGVAGAVSAVASLGVAAGLALTLPGIVPNAYAAVSSFVAICKPDWKNFLNALDDVGKAFKGRPAELSRMKRQLDTDRHEEAIAHIRGEQTSKDEHLNVTAHPLPPVSTNQQMLTTVTQQLNKALADNNTEQIQQLTALKNALTTVINAEKLFTHNENEQDFVSHQRQNAIPA